MKTLEPPKLTEYEFADMEDQLNQRFYSLIFRPVLAIINNFSPQPTKQITELKNSSENEVVRALRSGQIQYMNGTFSGNFNAQISGALRDIGAVWYKRSGVFYLPQKDVSYLIQDAATTYLLKAQQAHHALMSELTQIQVGMDDWIKDHPVNADMTISRVEKNFQKVGKRLQIQPELNEASKDKISQNYSMDMEKYIKNFSNESLISLREIVEANSNEGYRFDKLIDEIKRRYEVSRNKAKFLARQETSLFMSAYQQTRYEEAGVLDYIWSTSGDIKVRPDPRNHVKMPGPNHRHLNGHRFSFKSPPIVDLATGRRANPGEDYNCRCRARPILPEMKRKAA